MTLVDPTGGVGYSFGQKLSSTDMTTIATQQPNALDATNGGTYTCANALNWTLQKKFSLNVSPSVPGGDAFAITANGSIYIQDGPGGGTLTTTVEGNVSLTTGKLTAQLSTVRGTYQGLTVDQDHTITGFVLKSTFVPTVDRTLTLSGTTVYKEGAVVMFRINNTSVNKNIIIKSNGGTTIATLGAGAGTECWIQIAFDSSNAPYSLAWDASGHWTIAV